MDLREKVHNCQQRVQWAFDVELATVECFHKANPKPAGARWKVLRVSLGKEVVSRPSLAASCEGGTWANAVPLPSGQNVEEFLVASHDA